MRIVSICLIRTWLLFRPNRKERECRFSQYVKGTRFRGVISSALNAITHPRFRLMSISRLCVIISMNLPRVMARNNRCAIRQSARRLCLITICVRGVLQCVNLMLTTSQYRYQVVTMVLRRNLCDALRLNNTRIITIFRLRLRTSNDSRSKSNEQSRNGCLYFLSTVCFRVRTLCCNFDHVFLSLTFVPIFRCSRMDNHVTLLSASRRKRTKCTSMILCFKMEVRGLVCLLSCNLNTLRTQYEKGLCRYRRVTIVFFQGGYKQPFSGRRSDGRYRGHV